MITQLLHILIFLVSFSTLFESPLASNTSENEENNDKSLSIVLVKRDVTNTIAKRSAKGADIVKQINNPENTSKVCSQDESIMVYLEGINPESIMNSSTIEEVFNVCSKVSDGLDKINLILQKCRIVDNKNLYLQIIKGVDKLYDLLCEKDSKFKEDLQNHFPCITKVHQVDNSTCFALPDLFKDGNKTEHEKCKKYKDISECYYIKTSKVCGGKAAEIVKTIVTAFIPEQCLTKPTGENKATTINTKKIILFVLYIIKRLYYYRIIHII